MCDASQAKLHYAPFLLFGRIHNECENGALGGASLAACYHLLAVNDGTVSVEHGGRSWVLRAGEACILEPGGAVSWQEACHFARITFDLVPRQRRLKDDRHAILANEEPQPGWYEIFGIRLPPLIDKEVLASLRPAILSLSTASTATVLSVVTNNSILSTLMANYVRFLHETEGAADAGKDRELVLALRLEEYLRTHYHLRGVIKQAAEEMAYSPEHLSREYRKVRGTSPQQFLREFRLGVVCQTMRREPQVPLGEVAQRVGWSSAHSLRQAFRDHFGVPPRQWLRSQSS